MAATALAPIEPPQPNAEVTPRHHLAAIAKAHRRAELPNPCKDSELLLETMKGIRNSHGAKVSQKAALCTDDLRFMLRHAPDSIIGIRDQALLLIGFAGAFRRSELVALDVEDLTFSAAGVVITIRKSKTDQAGEGQKSTTMVIKYIRRSNILGGDNPTRPLGL